VRRQPCRASCPSCRPRRPAPVARPRSQAQDHRRARRHLGLRIRRQLEPPRKHRVDDDRIGAIEVEQHELAATTDRDDALTDKGGKFGGCAADRERAGSLSPADRAPAKGGIEGLDDHGQIREFGHGFAIVAAGGPVLDSPGPSRHRQLKSGIRHQRTRRSGPRSRSPRTRPNRPLHGLSNARAVRDSWEQIHHQE
jgi:hypothetical protein